jgi:hypothetical protein
VLSVIESQKLMDKCTRLINDNKIHVIKTFKHFESLKHEMERIHKATNKFLRLTKEIIENAKKHEEEFDRKNDMLLSSNILSNGRDLLM